MNSFTFLLFPWFALALKHAYLEAFLHKAFDPLFGDVYVHDFLAENHFDYYLCPILEQIKWTQRAKEHSPAWLSKLGLADFFSVIQLIYATVSKWKNVVNELEVLGSEDVVRECAMMSKRFCNSVLYQDDEIEMMQEIIYLVYRVHVLHTNTLTSYFELLNETNEYLEKALLPLDYGKVIHFRCEYEEVNSLARVLLAEVDEVPDTSSVVTKSSANHAKEALRLVNLARNSDANVVEEMMIGNCKTLPSILNQWLKGKPKHFLLEILSLHIFPLAVKSIEREKKTSCTGSTYPLPLPLSRDIQAMEKSMLAFPNKTIGALMACEWYRKVLRSLYDLYRAGSMIPASRKLKKRDSIHNSFFKMCADAFPPNVTAHFRMHFQVMNYALEYHPYLTHFSKLPVSAINGKEWDYLQNLVSWINDLSKAIPERERKEYMQLMLQFVTLEVSYLFPVEERELMRLSVILMIDGGLETYYSNQFK